MSTLILTLTLLAVCLLLVDREQNEDDDAALQKYHQDAVDGKFRTKKRGNGIVLDDSDSDPDDDEDARRIRQRMYKKRRVDDDQLEALSAYNLNYLEYLST